MARENAGLNKGRGCWFLMLAMCLAVLPVEAARADEVRTLPSATTGGAAAVISSGVFTRATGTDRNVEPLEPLFVRPFGKIEPGRNDGNPVWSPSGMFLAFERSIGDKKEIHIALADGTDFQTVYHQLSGDNGEMKFFFPGVVEDVSYNAGITWSPREDRFVFMSNGGEGNYDLYLGDLGGKAVARLTDHKEKDGQPHWSPIDDTVVFVSGRTGKGDLYLMDLRTRALTRLTMAGKSARGDKEYLYPQISPDGRKIVMIAGSNENHDIVLIADPVKAGAPQKQLTVWNADDLRPIWSPDGKKIAFYSNYNAAGDPRLWSIFVIAADGSDPVEGDGLAANRVAEDVIPDVERGPAWMPDSARIVFVKNDRQEYNPLYVVDTRDRTALPLKTETRMNHDVACSADGTIAFRAQVNQWDQIFVAKLRN